MSTMSNSSLGNVSEILRSFALLVPLSYTYVAALGVPAPTIRGRVSHLLAWIPLYHSPYSMSTICQKSERRPTLSKM